MAFPPVPDELKPIAHYLKVAEEHDKRDIIISYWCRLHALDIAIKLNVQKNADVSKLLLAIMEWLEKTKSDHHDIEAINSKVCAQATVENYALKLFTYADEQDRLENYGKNVVKAFYTAGILMDVLMCFGELSEDIIEKRKYAKWKAAYIHNCLKAGEHPVPGPMANEGDDTNNDFPRIPDPVQPSDNAGININSFPDPPGTGTNTVPNPSFPGSNPGPSNWNVFPSMPQQPTSPGINFPPGSGSSSDLSNWNAFPSVPQQPTPTGTVPSTPAGQTLPTTPLIPVQPNISSTTVANLDPEQISKAQKYCKWASSALNYDDVKNAIENLQKALYLLQFGKEMESPA